MPGLAQLHIRTTPRKRRGGWPPDTNGCGSEEESVQEPEVETVLEHEEETVQDPEEETVQSIGGSQVMPWWKKLH